MVQVKFTLASPLDETSITDVTAAPQKIDSQTRIASRNPSLGEVTYEFPNSEQPEFETLAEQCRKWVEEPNPTILAYNLLRE